MSKSLYKHVSKIQRPRVCGFQAFISLLSCLSPLHYTSTMRTLAKLFAVFALTVVPQLARTQPPTGPGADKRPGFGPVQPESPTFRKRTNLGCSANFRELDGTCTNDRSNLKKTWASTNRPQFSYFALRGTDNPRGTGLKSPREISNILSKQMGNPPDERKLAEIATFIGQFIDHTLVATPTDPGEKNFTFKVPAGDDDSNPFKSSGVMPFTRSQRVRVALRDNMGRPQNSLSSVIDLNNVYGPSKERNSFLRTGKDGLMKTSPGNYMPRNRDIRPFVNAPPGSGKKFFLAGDHRSNEHPVLTSLHTIFLREHNDIAREIKPLFPSTGEMEEDDEMLFEEAKKINEAQWQRIVFEEWYPAVTGRQLPKYRGFKPNTDPTVSLAFSTAAFRVGHTMVGNQVNRRGVNNKKMPPLNLMQTFFQGAQFIINNGVEVFLRGAVVSRAQKIDVMVVDALRNFLFKGISGESDNFDLVAVNLQRGRDHALPSYNAMRTRFIRSKATKFSQITKNKSVQKKLKMAYGTPSKVEAWPGLVAEDHVSGSSFGPTLLEIWKREFTRLRDGDRFFFRKKGVFSDLELQVPRLQAALRGDDIMRGILLRNTNIKGGELPKKIFFVN